MTKFPQGEALLAESRQYTPGGVHSMSRHIQDRAMFVRSRGAYLYDMDGHAYLDYHATPWNSSATPTGTSGCGG